MNLWRKAVAAATALKAAFAAPYIGSRGSVD